MHRTTIHIASFGTAYNAPKRSNVFAGINISIFIVSAVFALKRLVLSVSDVVTNRTSLRGVRRIYNNQFNPISFSLVFQESTKLAKRPSPKLCLEFFTSPFRGKSNSGQIFDSNSFALFFCSLYDRLRDCVINDGCGSTLSSRKSFKQFSRTASAFTLQGRSNLLSFFSILIKPVGRMANAVRSRGDVIKTKVNANKFFNVNNVVFWNFNSLKQVKLSFFINQISFSFNIGKVSLIVADKWNFLATANTPNRYPSCLVVKDSAIIGDSSKRPKPSLRLSIKFIGVRNLRYAAHNYLRCKASGFFDRMITGVMKFELIKNSLLPGYVRNDIAGDVCLLDCIKKQVSLFIGWQKFYFQCQLHGVKIRDIFKQLNKPLNFYAT